MTLWLTRIVPDTGSREARRDLNDPIGTHRRIMSLFPSEAGPDPRARFGVLFRTEDTPAGPHLLVQSTHKPDTSRLPDAYGTTLTRPLDALIDAIRPGLTSATAAPLALYANPAPPPAPSTTSHP